MGNWFNSKANVELLSRIYLVKEEILSEISAPFEQKIAAIETAIEAKITALLEADAKLAELQNKALKSLSDNAQAGFSAGGSDIDVLNSKLEATEVVFKENKEDLIKRIKEAEVTLQKAIEDAKEEARDYAYLQLSSYKKEVLKTLESLADQGNMHGFNISKLQQGLIDIQLKQRESLKTLKKHVIIALVIIGLSLLGMLGGFIYG